MNPITPSRASDDGGFYDEGDEDQPRYVYCKRADGEWTAVANPEYNGTIDSDDQAALDDSSHSSNHIDYPSQEGNINEYLATSSSTNKRKYEEDSDSSVQPTKQFKQDSSDITNDTEPFDFGGGDD